jgi:hypothetical protein
MKQEDYDKRLDKVQALLSLFEREPFARECAGAFIKELRDLLEEEQRIQEWLRNRSL